jgi:hypothetical protein
VKKLFLVQVETEVAVYAENQGAAEDTARKHIRDLDAFEFYVHANELTTLKLCDPDIADSPPYGTADDKTVRQLLEEIEQARKQEELKL